MGEGAERQLDILIDAIERNGLPAPVSRSEPWQPTVTAAGKGPGKVPTLSAASPSKS